METNGDSFDKGIGMGSNADSSVNDFRQKAQNVAEQTRSAANEAVDKAKLGDVHGHAMDATADLREQALKYKDQALNQARHAAKDGKTKAARTIHGVAGDLREAAGTISRNPTIAPVGKYANQAADALEDFAGNLRDKDIDQLVVEVSRFVQRNPAIAIGAAVAAGFAITQLLRGRSSYSFSDYDRYDS